MNDKTKTKLRMFEVGSILTILVLVLKCAVAEI